MVLKFRSERFPASIMASMRDRSSISLTMRIRRSISESISAIKRLATSVSSKAPFASDSVRSFTTVSGVRSSWLALATKLRSSVTLDCSLFAMLLKASARRRSSRVPAGRTRTLRSPPSICPAAWVSTPIGRARLFASRQPTRLTPEAISSAASSSPNSERRASAWARSNGMPRRKMAVSSMPLCTGTAT